MYPCLGNTITDTRNARLKILYANLILWCFFVHIVHCVSSHLPEKCKNDKYDFIFILFFKLKFCIFFFHRCQIVSTNCESAVLKKRFRNDVFCVCVHIFFLSKWEHLCQQACGQRQIENLFWISCTMYTLQFHSRGNTTISKNMPAFAEIRWTLSNFN